MFETILGWIKEYCTWVLMLVNRYGKKAVLTVLLVAALIGTTYFVVDYKIKQVVPPAIEKTIDDQESVHQERLVISQEVYVEVKQKLRSVIRETGCEYIYLIEYHNGSENMVTSFPFYKFDVTMEICKDGVPYINTSQLKDEHIFKYDIFDNAEYTCHQFAFCSRDQFKKVDPKLYRMIEDNEDIHWIYTYNLYYKEKLMGAILILSYEELDIKPLINNLHEVEAIFNSVK